MSSAYPYGPPKHKVCLLGASGGIGQPLAMLLKLNPMINELALYDIKQAATPCPGVAADVSHIDTNTKVGGFAGDEEMAAALKGSSVVVISAGVPRKPGMTRDDLFNINAKIVKGLAEACLKHTPTAMILIITNPVNSTVPIAAEVFKKAGAYDWRRILGVTTLDCVRASTFVAEKAKVEVKSVNVPVIGGHAGETILPLLSQVAAASGFSASDIEALDKRIQDAGTEVVNAKNGAGSATLSMAYAASKFTDHVLMGISGVKQTCCCYIGQPQGDCAFFANQVEIGPNGVSRIMDLPKLSPFETRRLAEAKKKLLGDIQSGIDFVHKN